MANYYFCTIGRFMQCGALYRCAINCNVIMVGQRY